MSMVTNNAGTGHGWRGMVATWSTAAWLVMQQFGIPSASTATRETRIVRTEDMTRSLVDRELLPDGRILTIPIDEVGNGDDRNRSRTYQREESPGLN